MHVPEVVTGLIDAGFIGLAFYASVYHNRREAARAAPGEPGQTFPVV